MGCSNNHSLSITIPKPRKQFPLEHRPRMLKDFLFDDSNSCSSTGFKSFPRKPTSSSSSIRNLIENDLHNKKNQLLIRIRSKPTMSAFQAMIKAVKSIHFTAVKSPSIIPRSLSRRLSSKRSNSAAQETKEIELKVTVTIKDIIRWTSFRDIIEEKSPPLDLSPSSPHHCTTTTTTTVSTATTPCSRSSNGSSSWCDSDFTSEYLPCWNGNSEKYRDNEEVKVGKINLRRVGEDVMEAVTMNEVEERQQNSPVSVIDIEYEDDDDEECSSSFDQSLATVERTKQKLMQKIGRFENLAGLDPINLEKWMSVDENTSSSVEDSDNNEEEETNTIYGDIEEEAWKLWNHVRDSSSSYCKDINKVERTCRVVLDYFKDELCRKRFQVSMKNDDGFEIESEMVRRAKAWVDGENTKRRSGWEKKEGCVKDMEAQGKWNNKYEEEQQHLALAIENGIMGVLVDELLIDLFSSLTWGPNFNSYSIRNPIPLQTLV